MQVFRITTEICKQVFPVTLDVDHPAFQAGLERLLRISRSMGRAKTQGGLGGRLKRVLLGVAAGATIVRLYLLPPQQNELPPQIRLAPAW